MGNESRSPSSAAHHKGLAFTKKRPSLRQFCSRAVTARVSVGQRRILFTSAREPIRMGSISERMRLSGSGSPVFESDEFRISTGHRRSLLSRPLLRQGVPPPRGRGAESGSDPWTLVG